MSSILSLPYELIAHIFSHCLPPQNFPTPTVFKPSSNTAPLLLTQICRYWRSVAHGTPKLWCTVEWTYKTQSAENDVDELLVLWLQRAGAINVSLTVENIPLKSLFDILQQFPTISRLNLISIASNLEQLFSCMRLRLQGSFTFAPLPSLRSLYFGERVFLVVQWFNAPNLCELGHSRNDPGIHQELVELVRNSACARTLTALRVSAVGATPELTALLRAAPALRSLSLSDARTVRRSSSASAPESHILAPLLDSDVAPDLETLEVRGLRLHETSALLENIVSARFPRTLEELSLVIYFPMEGPQESDTLQRLEDWEKKGLRVRREMWALFV